MKVAQVAQRAVDLDRAVAFYESVIGRPAAAVFDPPGLAFFYLEGVRLLLDRNAPSALVYLTVADVRTRTDELRRGGITILSEPHIIFSHPDDSMGHVGMDEWMSFIEDSEGNTVGLVSWTPSQDT